MAQPSMVETPLKARGIVHATDRFVKIFAKAFLKVFVKAFVTVCSFFVENPKICLLLFVVQNKG